MKALWTPSESFIKKTNIFKFQKFLEKDIKKKFTNYEKLWKWSSDNKEIFWLKLSEYLNITVHKKKNFISYKNNKNFIDCVFFNNSEINYYHEIDKLHSDSIAIKFLSENNYSNHMTYKNLHNRVNSLAWYFKEKKLSFYFCLTFSNFRLPSGKKNNILKENLSITERVVCYFFKP